MNVNIALHSHTYEKAEFYTRVHKKDIFHCSLSHKIEAFLCDHFAILLVLPAQHRTLLCIFFLKDTHREKAPSNGTPALTKSTNMGIWVVGTTNQLFIRGS